MNGSTFLRRRLVRPRPQSAPPPTSGSDLTASNAQIVDYLTVVLYGEEDAAWAREVCQYLRKNHDHHPVISSLPWHFQWRLWLLWNRHLRTARHRDGEEQHIQRQLDEPSPSLQLSASSWLMSILVQAQLEAANGGCMTDQHDDLNMYPTNWAHGNSVATASQNPMIRCWTHHQRCRVLKDIPSSSDRSCFLDLVHVTDAITGYNHRQDEEEESTLCCDPYLCALSSESSMAPVVSQLYRHLYLHSHNLDEPVEQQQLRVTKLCRFLSRQGGRCSNEYLQVREALWQKLATGHHNNSILFAPPSSYRSFVLERFMALVATVDPLMDDEATVQGRALLWYLLNRQPPVDERTITMSVVNNSSNDSADNHPVAIETLKIQKIEENSIPSLLQQHVHEYLLVLPLKTRIIPDAEALVLQLWNIMETSTDSTASTGLRAAVLAVVQEFQSWLPLPPILLEKYHTLVLMVLSAPWVMSESTVRMESAWMEEHNSKMLARDNHRTTSIDNSKIPSNAVVGDLTKVVWRLLNPLKRASFWHEIFREDDHAWKTKLLRFGFQLGLLMSQPSISVGSSATTALHGGRDCCLQAVSWFCAILEGLVDDTESGATISTTATPELGWVLDMFAQLDSRLLFDTEDSSDLANKVAATANELWERISQVRRRMPKTEISTLTLVESLIAFCDEYPHRVSDATSWCTFLVTKCLKTDDNKRDAVGPIWISKLMEYYTQYGISKFPELLESLHRCMAQELYSAEKGDLHGPCLLETLLSHADDSHKHVTSLAGLIICMTPSPCVFSGCKTERLNRVLSGALAWWPLTDNACTEPLASILLALVLHLDSAASVKMLCNQDSVQHRVELQHQCQPVIRKFLVRAMRLSPFNAFRQWERIQRHVTSNLESHRGESFGFDWWREVVLDFAHLEGHGTHAVTTSDLQILELIKDAGEAGGVKRPATCTLRDQRRKKLIATRLAAASGRSTDIGDGDLPFTSEQPEALASSVPSNSGGKAAAASTTMIGVQNPTHNSRCDSDKDDPFMPLVDGDQDSASEGEVSDDDEILLLDL